MVKNPPAMRETWVRSLGWEDPLEGRTGNLLQYSCLENPHGWRSLAGYIQSMGSQRVGHDRATRHTLLINTGFILALLVLNPHLLL